MPPHLRSTARLLLVALVAGTFAGCGVENPVGPVAMIQKVPLETARSSRPSDVDPIAPDPGTLTPGPGAAQDASRAEKKAHRQPRGKKKK